MEKRGGVNFYGFYRHQNGEPGNRTPKGFGEYVAVINLSCGVTPMFHAFGNLTDPNDRADYGSSLYRVPKPMARRWFLTTNIGPNHMDLVVTHCHYRPTKAEFDTLDSASQEHVLRGGLLIAELGKCVPVPDDPINHETEWDQFNEWAANYYGCQLPAKRQ